ncbi:hypothetical protein [Actinoallomurus rhizosphaericola]|uniref:hypothetical protein n=1 Tax=Actinoallomurus rhizosphaericola TaxID=2952536 RepID=UPI002090E4F9|nr:hypothetical protein [Actinoallomurus rhizosphaericola]MCO5994281.1 hypothetical protein [Actinoallomurus rhizosphaericola]
MRESAIEKVEHHLGSRVELPVLGQVMLPRPEKLVYYAGLGVLTALELVEWPVALAIGAGHLLADQQHSRVLHALGEAMEEA